MMREFLGINIQSSQPPSLAKTHKTTSLPPAGTSSVEGTTAPALVSPTSTGGPPTDGSGPPSETLTLTVETIVENKGHQHSIF